MLDIKNINLTSIILFDEIGYHILYLYQQRVLSCVDAAEGHRSGGFCPIM